jgi:hypothetical protein
MFKARKEGIRSYTWTFIKNKDDQNSYNITLLSNVAHTTRGKSICDIGSKSIQVCKTLSSKLVDTSF